MNGTMKSRNHLEQSVVTMHNIKQFCNVNASLRTKKRLKISNQTYIQTHNIHMHTYNVYLQIYKTSI